MKSICTVLVLLLSAPSARAEVDIASVMDRRWSASIAYGASSMKARTDTAAAYLLGAVDISVRVRLRPELQVGLAFGGSVSRELGYAGFVAEARYGFSPERPWNPFVFAGLGTGVMRVRDFQPLARIGLGIERRFQNWAFSAEARGTVVGGDDSVMPTNVESTLVHYGAWDASLTVSAIYYWGRGRPSRRLTP